MWDWIINFLASCLTVFESGVGDWGLAIIILVVIIRLILLPLTFKQQKSMAEMQTVTPILNELQRKYADDPQRLNQEMMKFYSEHKFNPLAGCLPMLIQMPVWVAMFNFVPNAIELRQQSFLWADDLSTYDDLIHWSTELPLIGNHISLFCLLFCVTNLLYSYITMRQQKDMLVGQQAEQMKIMQWMMYLMPVFFFFMFNKYSSGLNYYYFISLLLGALTMWVMRKTTDDKKLLARLEANFEANKNNPNKKPSGLAARLEALQKQQEALMEEQKNRKRK